MTRRVTAPRINELGNWRDFEMTIEESSLAHCRATLLGVHPKLYMDSCHKVAIYEPSI